jgi:hypothetical protein
VNVSARSKTTAVSPVLTTAPTTDCAVEAHYHAGQPVPTSATVASECRNSQPASGQNKQLASPRIEPEPEHEQWRTVRVGDPASRSWSPVRLSGACGPAGASSAAVRKDLNLNLSAVHEKIRSRAYGQRFRNWFRVKASGSIGPMCFKSGAVACAPPIVRDESSRVFLGGALQQSPPLRRPSSMVG